LRLATVACPKIKYADATAENSERSAQIREAHLSVELISRGTEHVQT